MESHHISVKNVHGVFVVSFNNLEEAFDGFRRDASVANEIGDELQKLIDQTQPGSLILDFEFKDFVPFDAFDARLAVLQRRVTQKKGSLRLCNLPSLVIQHYRITRLAEFFSIFDSLEDALKASIGHEPPRSD